MKAGKFDSVEQIIKSELVEYTHRNKIIKIADRHGWDVVKEYTIHPLPDNNDDAVKLHAAINQTTRRRSRRMIDRTRQISQADLLFVDNTNKLQQKQAHNNLHFNQDFVPNGTSRDTLPDNVRTRIDSLLHESRPALQLQLQQTLPSHPNNSRKDQVEYDLNFFDLKCECEIKIGTPSLKGKLKEAG